VFGPDNRYYSFPEGTTKNVAVSFFKKRGITSPEAPAPKPSTTALTPTPVKKAPEEEKTGYAAFGRGTERSFGIDPQKMAEAFHRGGASAQWHEAGAEFLHNLGQFGLSVLKDPFKVSEIVEAPARQIESGGKQVWSGLTKENVGSEQFKEKVYGGAGEMFGAISQVLGGGEGIEKLRAHATVVDGSLKAAADIAKKTGKDVDEAVTTSHKLSSGAPNRILSRRVFEDAYVHAKGLDVAKKIDKAAKAVHEEVKTHAEGIASQIDTKIPTGVVDAGAEAATIMKEFQDVVKTPEKAHPVLVQMVKDAQATAPKLWSWEKARQFRSSVGRSMSGDRVVGPQKVVLTKVYIDLTKKLSGAAKQYGLEKSWNQYNELASKMDKEFSDVTDSVTDAKSGQEVAAKLGKDVALTNELSRNLSKYGLKHKEILDFVRTSKRIQNAKNFMNRSLFRLVYGSAPGLGTAMSLRMAGAPYIAALGGGALVGLSTSYLVSLARVMKLSPEIIEHMMKERELPGKMKFEEGTFPDADEKALTEGGPSWGDPQGLKTPTAPPPKPAQPPAPKLEAKVEPTKVEPEKHGTGKLAEQAKARERVSKARAGAKRTKEAIETEAKARAQATHMDVSALQIPEMEEYLRGKNPTALKGLIKMRKLGTPDAEYIEALKYLILEDLEK
jgi:hypothetical protein